MRLELEDFFKVLPSHMKCLLTIPSHQCLLTADDVGQCETIDIDERVIKEN